MRILLTNLFLLVATIVFAQTDYYTKKGAVVEGYDVTEYFNDKAVKGNKEISSVYDGAKFLFTSEANREKFEANPEKYIPQYGGYCAYAIGMSGDLVKINPETYEIRGGKLYMFYNSWGTNTLKKWQENDPESLKNKADNNWVKINNKPD